MCPLDLFLEFEAGKAVSGSVEGKAVAETALPVETDVSVFLDRGILDTGAMVTDILIGLNLAFFGGTSWILWDH